MEQPVAWRAGHMVMPASRANPQATAEVARFGNSDDHGGFCASEWAFERVVLRLSVSCGIDRPTNRDGIHVHTWLLLL